MGQRARPGNKVASERALISKQMRSSNLMNPSDGGIEGSCSSSSGSEVAFLQSKGAKNQVHYVSSDGSLFTITANPNQLKRSQQGNLHQQQQQQQHQQQQQQQHLASLTHNEASSGSPNSVSTANLEPPTITQRQQQHRRLQNQVHQQLQRIYVNSGERQSSINQVEDRNQQYMFNKQHRQQIQQVHDQRGPLSTQARPPPTGFSGSREHNQSTQFTAAHLKNSHMMIPNNNHHHHQQQQQQQQQQQTDQIYDSLGSTSISKHLSDVYYIQDNQRPQTISAIPEEHGDVGEGELLIPEVGVVSKRAAIDRKHQLEDLHYATATAAALLSATASAAAAFAATGNQYNLPDKQPHGQSQQNIINSIYSDAYQDVRKQRCLNDQALAKSRYQQRRNIPIYSDALDQSQFMGSGERQLHLEPPTLPNAIYSPLTRANMAQSQVYSFLPSHYQQYHQPSNMSRQAAPQPPVRRMMNPQHEYQHQFQQRMIQQRAQLQQVGMAPSIAPANVNPQVPALAIVHHGKAAAIKANLIGRMLVNNILAAQRAAGAGNEAQYMAVNGMPVGRGRSVSNKMIENQNMACNMMASDKMYRPPAPVFSVASGMAPSDASGHSNVPLVIDRGLRPPTFIERICRIDLTLFWWSLLIVSFLFMGAIVTISRYIF